MVASVALTASPAVKLPAVIGDNMVLQQNSEVKLWGWDEPGKKVKVTSSWHKKGVTASADASGRWELRIPTPQATFIPQTLTFDDGEKTTLRNVLIGEVWFCSGQSNMEMPLRGFDSQPVEEAAKAIAYSANYPGIRVFQIPKSQSYEPQADVSSSWKESNPANTPEFYALSYFFARSLTDILHVPVGLVNCAYGGSKLESWLPKEIVDTYPEFDVEGEKNGTRKVDDWHRAIVNYNAMLLPVAGYTVKGFLWNQGESNVGEYARYAAHEADMVAHWRKLWNADLPFYSVELPGWEYGNPEGRTAAYFREQQHKAAELIPNSAVICTSDLINPDEVNDIHASRKSELGERLAFTVAGNTYGIDGIPWRSPTFKEMKVNGNKAEIFFNDAWNGFTPNELLEGFEVAGRDRKFYPATATQPDWTRHSIVVKSDSVLQIEAVRYNFRNFAIGKVHNLLGLPIVPFRTDSWPENEYVGVSDGEFMEGDTPYRYVGTNLWYGAILASEKYGDRARLVRELDRMNQTGIDNLRILVGGDGDRHVASHIEPTLQKRPGVYDEDLLEGLDWLLLELERRGMKAVLYLNNAWEWSGGYGQYLEWAGKGIAPVPAETSYPEYMNFVADFVVCDKAKQLFAEHVKNIVSRVNSVNGKPYSESPAIMSWQIANEPRCFKEEYKEDLYRWLTSTAKLIKELDPNHLVSTGSEGLWGCEMDLDLWTRIHADPNIDYANIHIWPYNWSWARPDNLMGDMKKAQENTLEYIEKHYNAIAPYGKPVVLEEFGFPRDGMEVSLDSPVTARDEYYRYVFDIIGTSGMIKGANFWGWGGEARPAHRTWQPGDDYTGDPAQEDQGLNSVFSGDESTLAVIKQATAKINSVKKPTD